MEIKSRNSVAGIAEMPWLKEPGNVAISIFALSAWKILLDGFGIRSAAISALGPKDLVRIAESLKALDGMLVHDLPLEWASAEPELRILSSLEASFDCDVTRFRAYHQIFCFLKKTPLDRFDLEAATAGEFERHEENLPCLDESMLKDLELLARKRVPSKIDTTVIQVKHGTGAVAEVGVKSLVEKLILHVPDARTKRMARWSGINPKLHYVFPCDGSGLSLRIARWISVKKSLFSLRGICAEPLELQYQQQGVKKWLWTILGKKFPGVKIRNQSFNQRLAEFGSLDRHDILNMATVDLKNASDSVLLELVRRVFWHNKPLLGWLLATRSTGVRMPSGRVLRSSKFSPMGSAVCFPILSLVCALITELALIRAGDDVFDAKHHYGVYGDDICCPAFATPELFKLLGGLGFTVNVSKSFTKGFFRESCGKDYYRGEDVSPIYYGYDPNSPVPAQFCSLQSFQSRAFDAGYRKLAKWALTTATDRLPSLMKTAAFGLGVNHFRSNDAKNLHLESRWNPSYFRREYLITTVMVDSEDDGCHVSEHYQYQQEMVGNIPIGRHTLVPPDGEIKLVPMSGVLSGACVPPGGGRSRSESLVWQSTFTRMRAIEPSEEDAREAINFADESRLRVVTSWCTIDNN